MISPIAPALMATALVAAISLYSIPDGGHNRAQTIADNYSIFHVSHIDDAINAYDNYVPQQGEASVVERIIQNVTGNGHGNGQGNNGNGNGNGGSFTTVFETVYGPPVTKAQYFATARDVTPSEVIAFTNMGDWHSQMFLTQGGTKVAVVTWPSDAWAQMTDDETMDQMMAQIAADHPTTPDFRAGVLTQVGPGNAYSIDGLSFNVSGLDAPVGARAIVSLFDAS